MPYVGEQWFKAKLPGLSDGKACNYRGRPLDRARNQLRPHIERAGYVFHRDDETPLGIKQCVFRSTDGPMYLSFACSYHVPPDTFGCCLWFDFRPGIRDFLFGSRLGIRVLPEQELHRILGELRRAGIVARPWDIIAEEPEVPC